MNLDSREPAPPTSWYARDAASGTQAQNETRRLIVHTQRV
jgi:hypothetical protein